MQLNPNELSELIKQRIRDLEEQPTAAPTVDERPSERGQVSIKAVLDSTRVRKIQEIQETLSLETRADALALAIDIGLDIVNVLQGGGRVTLRRKAGQATLMKLKSM